MHSAALMAETFHWISPECRRVVDALAMPGVVADPGSLAKHLGLRTRHQLARGLTRDGLPPFENLRAWIRIVRWVLAWEDQGTSLFRSAVSEGLDPAVCYRTVKRLTGAAWVRRALPRCRLGPRGAARSLFRSTGDPRVVPAAQTRASQKKSGGE